MASPPHDARRLAARAPRPARRGHPAVLAFWLDSPYRGFRWGCRCPSGDLTAPGSWSVHGRCATDRRRGTDPLAGHRRARTATAGTRPRNGTTRNARRADGGLRTGRAPGAGEATPAHAPARPPSWSMAGVVALRAPARPAPHRTRALSQHKHEADSPACARMRPRHSGPVRRFPDNLPPAPVFGPGARAGFGMRKDRHGSRAERHLRHDLACQPAFHPATPSDGYPASDPAPRPADAPAAPDRAVAAGQRLNIPAGGDRD